MHVVGYQEAQLGGILKHCWNFGCTTPIVVQMRMFVRPNLQLVRAQVRGIMYDIVVGW